MHMHMSLGRRGLNSLGAPPRVETAPADGDDMQQPGAVLLTRGHRAERLGAAGDAHARSAPPFGGLRGRGAPHTAAAAGDVRVKDRRTLALTLTLTPIPALASAPALAMHIALALAPALALALAPALALALALALSLALAPALALTLSRRRAAQAVPCVQRRVHLQNAGARELRHKHPLQDQERRCTACRPT